MIPVSPDTLHFVEAREDNVLTAYLDKRNNGTWTIGVGMTRIYGRPVREGDKITQKQSDQWFGALLQYFQNHVIAMIKPEIVKKLKPRQITALVSLAYNIGLDENHNGIAEGFGDSTLLKKLNLGDFKGCAAEFPKWCRSGPDKTLLLPRRLLEQKEFLA